LSKNQAALDRLYRHVARHYSINSISFARKNLNATILFWACLCNQAQDVRALLKAGAGMALTRHGEMIPLGTNNENHLLRALQIVAKNGFAEVMQALLENGVSGRLGDDKPESPLNFAIEFNHTAIIKALLEHGADSNHCFPKGVTRLMNAAARGHLEAVKLLLEHLAHYDARLPNGLTALHYAAASGQYETAKLLLRQRITGEPLLSGSPPGTVILKCFSSFLNLVQIHRQVHLKTWKEYLKTQKKILLKP
jgi:ankyrin repeat protein